MPKSYKKDWKENWSCEGGFDEIGINLAIDDCGIIGADIDACVDSLPPRKEGYEAEVTDALQDLLHDDPSKIFDLYVRKEEAEKLEQCGFKVHKSTNPLFFTLDKQEMIKRFKDDTARVENLTSILD